MVNVFENEWAEIDLANEIVEFLEIPYKEKRPIVFVCIGTDRCTGDSYAPLVGYFLKHHKINNMFVYGNIEEPVHAKNLELTLQHISVEHENALIVAVDANLGTAEYVNTVCIKYGSLNPGSGVGKTIAPVGDVSIFGTVNISGFAPLLVMQCTRLRDVLKLAEVTSKAIKFAFFKLKGMG